MRQVSIVFRRMLYAAALCLLVLTLTGTRADAASGTIRFNANGGTGTMKSVDISGGKVTLPANEFRRYGYIFRGWATSAEAVSADYDEKAVIKSPSSMTLYALWEPQMYIIHFDGSGETSGEMDDIYALYDQKTKLPQNQFYKKGYRLKGWKDESGNLILNLGTVRNLDSGNTYSRKIITVDAGKPENSKYTFRSTQGSVVFGENGKQYLVTAAGINDESYYDGDLSHYETVLTQYDLSTGKVVKRARNLAFDHGNGICYNPDNGHFYIAEGGSLEDYPGGVLEVDHNFKKVKEWNFPLLTNIWAIAYEDHHFYVIGRNEGSRNSFCVLNDEMKTLSITEADQYYTQHFSSQGIAADANFIYAVSAGFQAYEWKTKQRINVFTHEGDYIGAWTLDIPNEAEDVTVIDGTAYITTNEKKKATLYETELPSVTLRAVWTK